MAYITRQGKGSRMSIPDLDGTLNYLFTASANAATSSISASYAATASYISDLETPTYTEVAISSAQILNMGSTEIELLPALLTTEYYDISKLLLEYTNVTTPYSINIGDNPSIYFDGVQTLQGLDINILTSGNTSVTTILPGAYSINTSFLPSRTLSGPQLGGGNLMMSTWNNDNPTGGDGTILAKIWYKVRTFGTEL